MKHSQQPPLHLQAEVSRYLAIFLIIMHAGTALVIVFMPAWVGWAKVIALGGIVYSLIHYWRLHIQRVLPRSVESVVFYAVDNWRVHTPAGSCFASLLDSSFISAWLCVLNLQADDQPQTQRKWQWRRVYTLILLPDSLPQETLRQLRVRLKFA